MESILSLPEWFGAAILGAVIAALGYVGKIVYEWIDEIQDRKAQRRARLAGLISMLRAEHATYRVQSYNRDRLKELILQRDPKLEDVAQSGFESLFSAAYGDMSNEEKELHTIVRSYTINSIRPLNLAAVEWLKNDNYFKIPRKGHGLRGEVGRMLAQLDAHLLMWEAKYQIWIPDRQDHSLVYLDDEKKHGIPFPAGIENKLEQLLETGI